MQSQEESLLAAQMAHSHLHGDDVGHDDVGRTDSKRGLRGAMAPKIANSLVSVPSHFLRECTYLLNFNNTHAEDYLI
jgi:hypothetical protein